MKQQLLDLLSREDLSADMQRLADIAGLDVVRRVISEFNGERIDVPGRRTLRRLHERYIKAHLVIAADGTDNRRIIAREIGVSIRYVEQRIRHLQGGV
jgi:hypothetical protein